MKIYGLLAELRFRFLERNLWFKFKNNINNLQNEMKLNIKHVYLVMNLHIKNAWIRNFEMLVSC